MEQKTISDLLQDNIENKEYLNNIISIFSDINNGIVRLYRFAGEDFKLMRDQYKQFNRRSIIISDNANNAFEIIGAKTGKDSTNLIDELKLYCEKQENYYSNISFKIKSVKEFINELSKNTKSMLIPVKNLNQNINSLKLVLASLKLNPTYKPQSNKTQNSIDPIFELIKEIYSYFDKGIGSILDSLSGAKKQVKTVENFYSNSILEINEKFNLCKEIPQKKNQEALKRSRELSNNIQENTGTSHKIIIELQYHDIIRQKIEHIMEVHTQIINRLSNYKKSDDESMQEDIKKYLSQVGDIARIQASQLLHANNEYESAIDTISESLLSYSENLIAIVDASNKVMTNSDNTSIFHKVDEIIGENYHFRNKLNDASMQIDEQYLVSQNKLVFINTNFHRIIELIDKLNSSLEFSIKTENDEGDSIKILKSQARELLHNINSSVAQFKELFQSIMETNSKTNTLLKEKYSQEEQKQQFDSIVEFEKKILSQVSQSKETLTNAYKQNDEFTVNITDKILKVIRNVKYYDYFSTLAEGIIGKLNYISETLYANDSETDLGEIEYLKAKYTMYSERKIHDNSTQHSGSNVELFDDFDETTDGKKVEFFK